MAKIEVETGSTSASVATTTKSNKRKLKDIQAKDDDDDGGRSTEADSPTTKFKKLDISQIRKRRRHPHSQPVVSQPQAAAVASASATATSVVVTATELQLAATAPKKQTAKANKRKPKIHPNDSKPSKKAKSAGSGSTDTHNDNEADDEDGGDDFCEPTAAELSAADRPENVPQIETTRQKKRDKHAKLQQTAKVDSAEREQLRNREYLVQWRDQRDIWKFNKLRQISVTKALFREAGDQQLDDEMWQLAMEYLCGTKGQLRQLLRDAAQKVIDDTDARIEVERNEALVQSLNYTRARSFLQMMG